ncbi:MAG: nucleoside-diphosphate kinase [Candidatus Omnitrophica bacterium]|nr:nucleoside-diphosphate kinase [Candidatus Omnitrophota bacterium]
MREPVLVIFKPDAMKKRLVGDVLTKFEQSSLDLVAAKVINPTREKTEKHYEHLKEKPFFQKQVKFFMGEEYFEKGLLFFIFFGENAVQVCRDIAGATHPEEAKPTTVRGSYGRVNNKDIYENVVHVSSSLGAAEREIKLWFNPGDIEMMLFSTTLDNNKQKRIWV